MPAQPEVEADGKCQWISLRQALRHFALHASGTQSQKHIKPLHWYVACRLVLEGGFRPDEITPHPPFRIMGNGGPHSLVFDARAANRSERTVIGGLKTKNVDVVVTKEGIGPVLAISCKGTGGAFRNLTNRMEEAVGDCTNLHITYPALVCGFLAVLRANRREEHGAAHLTPEEGSAGRAAARPANDIAVREGDDPVVVIVRYHNALRELTDRRGIRDDVSRYETIGLALVEAAGAEPGRIMPGYPPTDSSLRVERFFDALYRRYDERYVYAAPSLERVTRRLAWSQTSPLLVGAEPAPRPDLDFEPRLADQA